MQKVIIIGATSGIGRALAERFLRNGAMVGITGRRKQLLDELQQQYPQQVKTAVFDVMGNENRKQLQQLIDELGGMDIFIYNSGFGEASKDLSWEHDEQITRINVNGFIETTNYAFNYFVQQQKGQIVGISSIASYRGSSWAPAYNASKAYMSNYLEGLSIKAERLKKKIVVTDIQPGYVQTDMAKGTQLFWIAPLAKAADQIFNAIIRKKRRVQVTKRWALVAWLLKWVPYSLYKKIG